MLQNIIDTETDALSASAISKEAAMILFDFAAAFPSMARQFLWIALRACKIPEHVIAALMQLYFFNIHFFQGTSGLFFAFVAESGVRQGCPLSSVVFVLATDCFVRALTALVKGDGSMKAYADDINVVVKHLFHSLPGLCSLFSGYGAISGLYLNPKMHIDSFVAF